MQADLYQKMYELESRHWWFVARRKIIATTLIRQGLSESGHACSRARILEAGCGTGGNTELLSRFGDLTSVEHDPLAVQFAQQKSASPVLQGSLPDQLPDLSADYDLACLFDVIEHIDDDLRSLQVVAGLLKPGGRLVLTVPAFNFLWSRHDEENQHKRRYRKRDIVELAREAGLRVDYVSYFNFWLFLPVAAVRVIRKIVPYWESWQDMRMPGAGINTLLEQVFSSERALIGRFSYPFGISLIAVLSKSD